MIGHSSYQITVIMTLFLRDLKFSGSKQVILWKSRAKKIQNIIHCHLMYLFGCNYSMKLIAEILTENVSVLFFEVPYDILILTLCLL